MGVNGKIRFLAVFAVILLLLAEMSPVIAQESRIWIRMVMEIPVTQAI